MAAKKELIKVKLKGGKYKEYECTKLRENFYYYKGKDYDEPTQFVLLYTGAVKDPIYFYKKKIPERVSKAIAEGAHGFAFMITTASTLKNIKILINEPEFFAEQLDVDACRKKYWKLWSDKWGKF